MPVVGLLSLPSDREDRDQSGQGDVPETDVPETDVLVAVGLEVRSSAGAGVPRNPAQAHAAP